jgi:membrane protease YdiL (CAAX protease family)
MPLIYFLSYAIMRLTGMPLPDPKIPLQLAPAFFLMFFPAAAAEETGWMGYAFDPMQNRWGAVKASILLGFVWAIWHLIPDLQGRHPAKWIVWHRFGSVVLRVLIGWIYNKTGKSVLAASLFHTMDSVSWALFPNFGSHYNPFITSMISGLTAIGVILVGRPNKLARNRYARSRRV